MRPTIVAKVVLFLIGMILILTFFTGCTSNYHLKKAKRHLLIAESKGANVKTDSIYKWKTFRIPARDAVFVNPFVRMVKVNGKTFNRIQFRDTIIYKNKIKIQIKDSLIYVECPEEVKKEKVAIKTETEITPKFSIPAWWWIIAGVVVVLVMVAKIFKP